MTDNPTEQPWLLLHIDGPTGGVDARALAQLLQDMVGVARLIADEKLTVGRRRGPMRGRRRGPMSAPERALAGLRVTSVSPGSVNIAFATPSAAVEQQSSMLLDPEVTPAAIARQLIEEFESVSRKQPPTPQGHGRRQAVERVVRSVARIGNSAELVHHPPDGEEIRVRIVLAPDASTYEEPMPDIRQRVMFGQVFMADVEDGRQRVRVKLADESDLTMSLERDLAGEMPDILGQLAELHVSEALVGETVVERVVGEVRLLAAEERGIEIPPKSIDELAREQGLFLRQPPDYFSILSGLWESEEEAEAFRKDIRSGRAPI